MATRSGIKKKPVMAREMLRLSSQHPLAMKKIKKKVTAANKLLGKEPPAIIKLKKKRQR